MEFELGKEKPGISDFVKGLLVGIILSYFVVAVVVGYLVL